MKAFQSDIRRFNDALYCVRIAANVKRRAIKQRFRHFGFFVGGSAETVPTGTHPEASRIYGIFFGVFNSV